MDEEAIRKAQGQRLAAARKAAKFDSARAAALENSWAESSYRAHENGTRTIGLDDAERYARRFRQAGVNITAKDILFGPASSAPPKPAAEASQPPRPRGSASNGSGTIPLISWVAAGRLDGADVPPNVRAEKRLPRGDLPAGRYIALRVRGNSMDRVAPDGSIILVDIADDRLLENRFYVVTDERGDSTFKRYRGGRQPRLQPFSTDPDQETIPVSPDMRVVGRVRRVILDLD